MLLLLCTIGVGIVDNKADSVDPFSSCGLQIEVRVGRSRLCWFVYPGGHRRERLVGVARVREECVSVCGLGFLRWELLLC